MKCDVVMDYMQAVTSEHLLTLFSVQLCVFVCVWISYFSQTVHLLEQDDSIYCISAWNDLVLSLHEYSLLLPSVYFHIVALPVCFGRVGDTSMCME